ncbi:hypothetical protein HGP16_11305 [Rhizobium sp. P40RR-XXII]|uniref:hypothetical protein n=1 Tax=Rhizobium sp. P40RR-XXII TaxID=2726739 RepID=UPI0014569536|nr:hypothetical protein [Rhizobium sp. P40RR-XXII]NLS17144.1 hypothetical protein [Rhizobium sp. P40RR-XXII]
MNPVVYSDANQLIIKNYEDRSAVDQAGSYWGDDEVAPIRKQIKDHYIAEQGQRCCYCTFEIATNNNAVWDGEHIISRDAAPRFMFVPQNLSISCKDCNLAKKEKEVRVNPALKRFPTRSEQYKIVHPHFDTYADHIQWFGKVVKPLTDKGIETVAMCSLSRFGKKKAGAEKVPIHPAMAKQIGVLMDPFSDRIDMHVALAGIKAYLETVQQD